MTSRSLDALDVLLPPQVRPASPTTILLASPTATPIDISSGPKSNPSRDFKPAPESHSDVGNQPQVNVSRQQIRAVLGGKAGAENLPVPRKKRRKLGDKGGIIVGNMEDSAGCARSCSQFLPDESAVQKPKAKNPRKSQKKQDAETVTNSRLKGKVIKASTASKRVLDDSRALNSAGKCDSELKKAGSIIWEPDGLQLEEATARRDYWTPIKDTNAAPIGFIGSPVSTQVQRAQDKSKDFRTLVSGFNLSRETPRDIDSDCQYLTEGPTTKQLLEFIPQSFPSGKHLGLEGFDAGASSTSEGNGQCKPARKPRKPAKSKITTITSLTTRRYESPFASESDFISLDDKEAESIQPARKASSSKRNATKAKPRSKVSKDEYQAQFKPAPTAEALKAIENQALIFGTSSQLERDSSPSVYGLDSGSGLEHNRVESKATKNISREPSTGLGTSRFSKSKNLWGASSRDLDGYLLNVEMVDLIDPTVPIYKPLDEQQTSSANRGSDNAIHEEIPPPIEPANAKKAEQPTHTVVDIDNTNTIQNSRETPDTRNNQIRDACMPDFDQLTTAALVSKVASFGFRPIKKREKMIELLEKCWESKKNATARPEKPQDTAPEVPLSAIPTPVDAVSTTAASINPSKRTVKPKKATSDETTHFSRASQKISHGRMASPKTTGNTTHSKDIQCDVRPDIIEIEDSTDEGLLESPKQLKNSDNLRPSSFEPSCDKPEGPEAFQIRTKEGSFKGKGPAELPNIFIQITNAVKAQPRIRSVKGVKQPTWHERIVMYDPIWLDDFTLWLNVEGFKRIHEDREVHTSLVRDWCESKGICCCFKNRR
ncbi:hypothetical protein MGYG_02720 [Nannizzia gypsea CBS 118893]|uniref:Structure-specific endonuclease subunit SLX4 n=1 Tax=Arthroderma gypseum (strain ATCC MYA-4604 / CBS 118893) TaxID=535722 RepID=E4UNV3_ARTGP|nr:hypothetical protein MGYG_02720 [Nannizzia gypsea CBS 118893]EFQ99706.1 hypothetical protein MGYG_02720 [Nannizzia gypsea CBS 118893]